MSFWSEIEGIFDPGGDPGAIHGAATACRTLATDLRGTVSALDLTAAGLEKSWKAMPGAEEESASAAFQRAWSAFGQAITEYAQNMDVAAGRLDDVADEIASADEQAAKLKDVVLATLAVGAGLTLFTFGTSDAAAEASAMAEVAVATGMMSALDAALASATGFLADLLAAFTPIAARFVMGAAFTLIPEMFAKAVFSHENPFDPANYSADDVLNIILSGLTIMGLGTLGAEVGPLSEFLSAHPIAGPAGYNAAGAALFGVIYQYWVLGKPVDRSTLETIAESSGISLGTGAAIGALGTVGGPVGRLLGSGPTEPAGSASPSALARALNGIGNATSTSKSDVVMNGVAVPASVIKYQFLISSPTPALAVPPAPPAPPAVPVPQVPPPQAPGLPPDSATRVVQPGDSVWEIAGGDPALAQRIAELNHLDDPSQIQPGQVLIVPPGP